jgi:receptor expression-enhancing protein 1/2/3/4
MFYDLLSHVVGSLYPAYASYKAVRTKNVKEYVRWMMYWIVLAFFNSIEPFADIFIGFWFPFYYWLKIGVLVWLLAPHSNGASLLYKKFIHPSLMKKEDDIDALLEEAKTKGYSTFKQIGGKGVKYVTNLLMEGMVRAPTMMAELVQTGQLSIESRRIVDVTDHMAGSSRTNESASGHSAQPMEVDTADVEATEESDFALDSESEKGKKDAKAKRKGRPRKASSTVDLTFSSGDDEQDPEFKVPTQRTRKTTRKSKKTT